MPTVVSLAHSRWPIAAGKGTSAVARYECPPNGQRNGSHCAPDVEGFPSSTQDGRNDFRVAGPPPGLGCTDGCPVVESRHSEAGAQGVPVDSDGQVRGFPGGGGTVLRGAGQPAHLEQGIGIALV